MIKPTVGRVVWYWPTADDIACRNLSVSDVSPQPFAATIVYVHSDRMVNLSVVDHAGKQFGLANVALLQDHDSEGVKTPGCAAWMPYQKGQAAKTEALELAAESCTQKVADDTSDLLRLILKPGTALKINGMPVQLVGEAMVAAHPSNVPTMFCDPGEADQARSPGN